jgi:hypothetical protein
MSRILLAAAFQPFQRVARETEGCSVPFPLRLHKKQRSLARNLAWIVHHPCHLS